MIERGDMMQPMLVACPSFLPVWNEFLNEWVGNPILLEDGGDGELPMYLALGDLVDHLVARLEAGDTGNFPAIFEVVELWINDGVHYVSEAAVVGFLENLQNQQLYKTASPKDWMPWLGPQSKQWWAEVDDFWKRLAKGKFRLLSLD